MYYYIHPLKDNPDLPKTTYTEHFAGAVDIDATTGEPIYSMTNGTVAEVVTDPSRSSGYCVIVQTTETGYGRLTGNPLYVRYMHMNELPLVIKGSTVSQGQLLGYVGNTGESTGDHLHVDFTAGDTVWTKTALFIQPKKDANTNWGNIISPENPAGNCEVFEYIMSEDRYNKLKTINENVLNWGSQYGKKNGECNWNYFLLIMHTDYEVIALSNELSGTGDYFEKDVPDNFITSNGAYTIEEQKGRIAALCVREIGGSLDGAAYTMAGIALYGKLLRARWASGAYDNLMDLFANSGFTGWEKLHNLSNVNVPSGIDKNVLLETCYLNFTKPTLYGLDNVPEADRARYITIAQDKPFFNYGYASFYTNTKENEQDLQNDILNGNVKSHISLGNTNRLSGVIGNTAYFPTI